jgi:hypothetical protein
VKTLRTIWPRIRSLGQRREIKQEIDEEQRCHLEQHTAENFAAERRVRAPVSIRELSTLCWSVTAVFLSFFCLTQLGVMLFFCAGARISPFLAPAALLLSLGVGDWLARREGLRGWLRIAPPATVLAVVALALFLAASFFDLSWDGLWYHQTAVYQMSHGWNPLRDPLHSFTPHLEGSLRHFAKGPWYVALALFQTTHHIEWAKASPWIGLAAMFLAVFAAAIDFKIRRRTAVVIAGLVSLNPVVTCQLASYLVDGIMVSLLACFVAALFRWFRQPSLMIVWIMMVSAILCINAKLTGLVYLCFFCAAAGVYALIKRRDLLVRFATVQLAGILLGTALIGYNPYVTNTVHWGNPFYPWLGSAEHPGISQTEQDWNELIETPKNMVGRSRFYRLAYAIFGRPGAQPIFEGQNARLMWPFDVGWKDFHIFYFHDVRVSGFGPLYSGTFLIGLCLMGVALVRPGIPREIVVLFAGAILTSLLVSPHTWWARFGPHLWWLPIVAVVAGLAVPGWRAVRWAAWSLAALLLINAVLVGVAHFCWELKATRTTCEQMAMLRRKGEIEVDFQYFRESFGERLRAAGVTFRAVEWLSDDNLMELMSVAPGNPGAVRARVYEK